MFGAFIGDVIGSTYEFEGIKTKDFSLFPPESKYTDDSIMTVAIGDALINWKNDGGELSKFFVDSMQHYGRKYPFLLADMESIFLVGFKAIIRSPITAAATVRLCGFLPVG